MNGPHDSPTRFRAGGTAAPATKSTGKTTTGHSNDSNHTTTTTNNNTDDDTSNNADNARTHSDSDNENGSLEPFVEDDTSATAVRAAVAPAPNHANANDDVTPVSFVLYGKRRYALDARLGLDCSRSLLPTTAQPRLAVVSPALATGRRLYGVAQLALDRAGQHTARDVGALCPARAVPA